MQRKRLGRVALTALLVAILASVAPLGVFASAYSTAVLADSPSQYARVSENTGTAISADVGHGYGCSAASWTGGPVSGDAGAWLGDGSHGCTMNGGSTPGTGVIVSSPTNPTATIEVWVKCCASGYFFDTWASGTSPCCDLRIELSDSGSGGVAMYEQDDTGNQATTCFSVGGDHVNDHAWHMIDLLLRDTAQSQIWLDGALCATAAGGAIGHWPASPTDVIGIYNTIGCYIGASCTTGNLTSPNAVAQLSYYHGLLSSGQMATHYAARAGGPPAHLFVTCQAIVLVGHTFSCSAQSTDSTGNDVTGSDTYTTITPVGITCSAFAGSSVNCIASAGGSYQLIVQNSTSLNTAANLYATVGPSGGNFGFLINFNDSIPHTVGQGVTFWELSADATGQDTSAVDPFTVGTLANMTCTTPAVSAGLHAYATDCLFSSGGSYSPVFTDTNGRTFTAHLTVTGPTASAQCNSGNLAADATCLLTQVWTTLVSIANAPFVFLRNLQNFLTVSSTGKNFVDFSGLGAVIVPSVACRSGQAPTHPDGVHCLPFPVSIPFDFVGVVSVLNVTPVSPTLDAHILVPPIDEHFTIDPTVVLNSTVMTWVRDAELVVFCVALAVGTYRFVQAWGGI